MKKLLLAALLLSVWIPVSAQTGRVSRENSTSIALSGGSSWTGEWDRAPQVASVTVLVNTDHDGTLTFQWSTDGVNIDYFEDITYTAGTTGVVTTKEQKAEYFRIKYVNGGVAQSFLRLQATIRDSALSSGGGGGPSSTVAISQSGTDNDVNVVGTPGIKIDQTTTNNDVDANITNASIAITAASLPLPTLASTSTLQTTGNTSLGSIDGKLASLGQKASSSSVPVVLASDALPAPDRATTGTLTAIAQSVSLLSSGTATTSLAITGSWVGTILFFGVDATGINQTLSVLNSTTSVLQSTTSANGIWILPSAGWSSVGATSFAWTSGTATIALIATPGSNVTALTRSLPAGTNAIGKLSANAGVNIGDVALVAGSSLIGKVGIDQTTPGTTNRVDIGTMPNVTIGTFPANQPFNEAQYGGTTVVNGGVNGLPGVGGNVAHDGVDSGNPVKIGCRAISATPTAVSAADRSDCVADLAGNIFNVQPFQWTCALEGIAATLTECKAAPAAGYSLYVTSVTFASTTGTAGTAAIRSGTGVNCGTATTGVLPGATTSRTYTTPINTAQPFVWMFPTGLKLTATHALCAIGVATNTLNITMAGYTAP